MNSSQKEVFNRIKQLEGLEFDQDLAEPLGVPVPTLHSIRRRGTIPWERIVEYAEKNDVSLEWLIHGHQPVRVSELAGADGALGQAIARLTNGERQALLSLLQSMVQSR